MNAKLVWMAAACAVSVSAWAATQSVAEREAARKERLEKTQKPAVVATATAPGGGAASEAMRKMTGDVFLDAGGQDKGASALAGKRVVLFYFSASWCGPCRAFTPELVKAYQQWKKDNQPVEVVLIGSDRDQKSMLKYMKSHDMPWLALPHGSKEGEAISGANGIRGIPALVVYDREGNVITQNGRGEISSKGADALQGWLEKAK